MKALFRNVPIRRKLTAITMLISCAALLVACSAFAIYEQNAFRQTMARDFRVLAQMFGDNVASGLTFNDAGSIEQTLKTLEANPHVAAAAVYNKTGEIVARYERTGIRAFKFPAAHPLSQSFGTDRLETFQTIHLTGEEIGTLYIGSDLGELVDRAWRYTGMVGILLIASSLVALLLGSKLQKIISEPIIELAKTAAAVALHKNYAVRAIKRGNDEVGRLIDAFNEMLSQIQVRDSELQMAREHLEIRVEERTRELQQEIVERHRSESALRESAQRFELVTRATSDVIWDWSLKTNIVWLNENFESQLGFPTSEAGEPVELWKSRIHPEDSPTVLKEFYEVIKGKEKTWSAEYRHLRADGSYAYIFDRAHIIRDERGEATRMIGAMQDITERKRGEEKLRENEEFVRNIVDTDPNLIFVKDREGRFVLVNRAMADFFGKTVKELTGKLESEVNSNEAAVAQYQLDDSEVMETLKERFVPEEMATSAAGQTVWLQTVKRPLISTDGKARHMLGVATDITGRKRSETFLNSILENMPITVFIKEPEELRFVKWNKAGEELTGYSNGEMAGKNDYDFFPQEQAETFIAKDREALKGGKLIEFEEVLQSRHKGKRIVRTQKIPILDESGRAMYLLGISEDITERKEGEAQLERVHKQLLSVSRQAGMAEVATGVLHNVGNVLNSVNVSAQLVSERMSKSRVGSFARIAVLLKENAGDIGAFMTNNPKGKQLPAFLGQLADHEANEQAVNVKELESLRKNIEHIKDIVAMQQNYAKVSGVTEIVEASVLLEDALRMNSSSLVRHGVKVVREFEEVPVLTIDKQKVLQILVNLIRNAKHACDDSGREEKVLRLRVENGDGCVRIHVVDNGVGIPQENLTRIFGHGFTTKKDGHGFGLHSGALAAKEIGGALTVRSEGLGQGAEFILELPVSKLTAPASMPNTQELSI